MNKTPYIETTSLLDDEITFRDCPCLSNTGAIWKLKWTIVRSKREAGRNGVRWGPVGAL